MKIRNLVIGMTLVIILSCWLCAGTGATPGLKHAAYQSSTNTTGALHFKAPPEWVSEKPGSSMRVAQYRLPKTEGAGDESQDASRGLYYFGAGQGRSVQAHLDRWIAQMEQPGRGSSQEQAHTE